MTRTLAAKSEEDDEKYRHVAENMIEEVFL